MNLRVVQPRSPRVAGTSLSSSIALFVLFFASTVVVPVGGQDASPEVPSKPNPAPSPTQQGKAEPQPSTAPTNPARAQVPEVKWTPVSDSDAIKKAIDRGLNFLIDNQRPDGSYGFYPNSDVGITALALQALATSPRAYREEDGPFISKAVAYILSHRQPDGGFYEKGQGLENYKTSITIQALVALDAGRKEPRYAKEIEAAREFVRTLQLDEDKQYDPNRHKPAFGGIGYGSDRRPDLSNTQFAIEALRASGLSEDSEEFRRAIQFIERCQNSAKNDLFKDREGEAKSTNDGGFMYSPGSTKAPPRRNADGTVSYSSYGSMTYAGVKSYIFAGLTRDDPRVQSAWKWICANYTVEENPGMATEKNPARGWQGLYYYYMMMARTMEALEVTEVPLPSGEKRIWAADLSGRMMALQNPDGSWINPVDRWWEGDAALTTAYATRALGIAVRHLETKP